MLKPCTEIVCVLDTKKSENGSQNCSPKRPESIKIQHIFRPRQIWRKSVPKGELRHPSNLQNLWFYYSKTMISENGSTGLLAVLAVGKTTQLNSKTNINRIRNPFGKRHRKMKRKPSHFEPRMVTQNVPIPTPKCCWKCPLVPSAAIWGHIASPWSPDPLKQSPKGRFSMKKWLELDPRGTFFQWKRGRKKTDATY